MASVDLFQAEGFYYSRDHLISAGCLENHDDETMFAIHSAKDWPAVVIDLQSSWGYGDFWNGPELIKQSGMRNGETNYVFRIARL